MNYLRACLLFIITTIVFQGSVNAFGNPKDQKKIPPPQCAQFSAHHICQQLGVPLTLRQVCEMMPAKDVGESMFEIKRFLEKAGLECAGVKVKLSALRNERLPVIAHMLTKTNEEMLIPHWIVVQEVDTRQIKILDGLGYQAVISYDNFNKEWDGYILRVTKPKNARRPIFTPRIKKGYSWIQFEKLFIDAGDIPQSKEGYRFIFPFRNNGKEDLRILKVKPDCKCAVAESVEKIIPPGGRDEIVIQFTFEDHRGRFRKSALVQSNDPYFPFVKLIMIGNGRQDVKIYPARLDLGNIPRGNSSKAACFLTYKGNSLFEITVVESPLSEMTINTEPVSPELLKRLNPGVGGILINECQNRYMVSANICTEGMELGYRGYNIEIHTNLVDTPSLSIPVSFSVVSPIRITPSRLFLGELHKNSFIQKKIELKSEMGEDFVIEYVDPGDTGLECEYSTDVPSSVQSLAFKGVIKNRDQLEKASICVGLKNYESETSIKLDIPVSGLFYE